MPTALTNQTALSISLIEAWTSIRMTRGSWVSDIAEAADLSEPFPGDEERIVGLKHRIQSLSRANRRALDHVATAEAFFLQADALLKLLQAELSDGLVGQPDHPEDILQFLSEMRAWREAEYHAAHPEVQPHSQAL